MEGHLEKKSTRGVTKGRCEETELRWQKWSKWRDEDSAPESRPRCQSSLNVTPAGMFVILMKGLENSTCIPDPDRDVASAAGAPVDVALSGRELCRGSLGHGSKFSLSHRCCPVDFDRPDRL